MKLLLLSMCVALAAADVSHVVGPKDDSQAQILSQDSNFSPDGNYQWSYNTENGIQSDAKAELKNVGSENAALSVQGQTAYTAPNGETVDLRYIADENGYQPQGSHIPTSPPIPEAIIRGLEYIRDHPPAKEENY